MSINTSPSGITQDQSQNLWHELEEAARVPGQEPPLGLLDFEDKLARVYEAVLSKQSIHKAELAKTLQSHKKRRDRSNDFWRTPHDFMREFELRLDFEVSYIGLPQRHLVGLKLVVPVKDCDCIDIDEILLTRLSSSSQHFV
jgi:hypothetical protein